MPNDAKLGLVVGLGLVLLVAVVFFGKELVPEQVAATSVRSIPGAGSAEAPPEEERPAAQTASQVKRVDSPVLPAVNEDVVKKE